MIIISGLEKLDRDYIQPRYPDAYPSGSPYEYYDENDAKISLEYAQNILNYVEEYINECSNDNKGDKKK
ncbi:HEPN domain-containing protein [Thermoanaerobacterium thermosaccharolyticum]|uniref:HEPN domain-containing protein n=1 Tax=Thermoanaerobacterium thermosaccharolyticum TaxID=1517 RepID=UPI0002E38739|nr:HEPN domain-containing protein [Thermoanaerobacterium thermosaccharolyticum]